MHYQSFGSPPRADGTQAYSSECRAAIITAVNVETTNIIGWESEEPIAQHEADTDTVDLCVLNPTGQGFNHAVPYDKDGAAGSWHWPERV